MAKQKNGTGWLLRFVASLAYLYVVWQLWSSPPGWLANGLSASLAAFGLGIIMATAVISSVSYVIATFSSGMMTGAKKEEDMRMSMWTWRMGMWSAFTLFVLTLPGPWSWLVLIGFVLSLIGTGMSKM